MLRIRRSFVVPVLLAAACSAGPSTTPSGAPPPGSGLPVTSNGDAAVSLGMSIMSADAAGVPRLMRSLQPRPGLAGAAPALIARDHVAALASLWVKQAPPMALVDSGTQPLRNGATIVKLAQQVGGVVVDQGELRVLLHTDGSLAAISGSLLPAMAAPSFVASPRVALDRALDQLHGSQRARPAITETTSTAGWQDLAVSPDPAVQVSDARARRIIASDAGSMVAAWEVEVFGEAPPDPRTDPSIPRPTARRYVVADATGKILGDSDLTQYDAFVYRVWAEKTGNRRPIDSPLTDFSPHPTGFPDGSTPTFSTPSNLVVMDSFNGPGDKWLPDNATTTTGNNADAFSDLDGTGTFTTGDVRPEIRSGRVLDYAYDTSVEPLANPTQIKAGVINTFYLMNWLHDWWYDSGFTEVTGTAQTDNYGRGGVAGDPMIVLAQAGALVGQRDNASMSTPADGRSPKLRVFVFSTTKVTSMTTPVGALHPEGVSAPPASFTLTGTVALAADATAPTDDACQPVTVDLTGKIALLSFSGVCGSSATVNNLKAAGAIGVIISDPASDDPRAFAGSATAGLPTLAIGKTEGALLTAAVAAGPVEVTLSAAPFGVERDGDLDDGVAGHEFGHYLHHRLAVCNSGQQCNGMSEGWGDFNWLLTQIREGDARNGTYAQGSYADFDGTPNSGYFSIRRFPYTSDHSKNPLSLRDIGDDVTLPTGIPTRPNGNPNSEVHNTGEIWALQMFEAYQVLIDAHGTTIARRRMSDYVAAGLMLTPPEATFTEARDAIMAAASALDTDDMTLIAAAFAGRGAGSCAVVPSNAVRNNAGVIESGTLAGLLKVGAPTLADDVVSKNHDGILDPGESGTIHLTVANGGAIAAENLKVTAATTTTGVKLGAPVSVPLLAPFGGVNLTIPVSLAASAPPHTPLSITLTVTAEQVCQRTITITLSTPAGLDDGPMLGAASAAPISESRVVSSYVAPATSLRGADTMMCIANDTP